MPYKGEYNGSILMPSDVPNGVTVYCTDCGGEMGVRCGPFKPCNDGRARHFFHKNGSKNEAIPHESDTHIRNKMASMTLLHETFTDNIAELTVEKTLKAPASDAESRQADVFLKFNDSNDILGEGVIIEVQHNNKNKDIDSVTKDYVKQGYSVVWVNDDDFDGKFALLDESDIYQRAKESVWPDHVPPDIDDKAVRQFTRWHEYHENTHDFAITVALNEIEHDYEAKGDPGPILPVEFVMQYVDWSMLIKNAPGTHEKYLPSKPDQNNQPVTFVGEAEKFVHDKFFNGMIGDLVAKYDEKTKTGFNYKCSKYVAEVQNSLSEGKISVTTGPWMRLLLAKKATVAYGKNAVLLKCPNCGAYRLSDPPTGKVNTYRCKDCTNWNTKKTAVI